MFFIGRHIVCSVHAQFARAKNDSCVRESGVQFASNYLKPGYIISNIREVYATSGEQEAETSVNIYNHASGKAVYYQSNIWYELEADIVTVTSDGAGGYNVNAATAGQAGSYFVVIGEQTLNSSNLSHTFEDGYLPAGPTGTVSYSVTFCSAWVDDQPDIYLRLVATAYSDSGRSVRIQEFPDIQVLLKPSLRAHETQVDWSGSFNDDDRKLPEKYDGYNYVVQGSGAGTFTLKWNNTLVDLSDVSLAEVTAATTVTSSGTSSSTSYLVFSVDSATKGAYELVFYKKTYRPAASWSDMNGKLATAVAALDKVVGYYFTAA